MLKLTLWFDKAETPDEHFQQLNSIIQSTEAEVTLVEINYSKDIANLIKQNNIKQYSFINLRENVEIKANDNSIHTVKRLGLNHQYIKTDTLLIS